MSSAALQQWFEGKTDFQGQNLADTLSRSILIALTILSFVVGFVTQSLIVCFGVFSAGTIALLLVVVPPWPIFNKHPLTWLPVKDSGDSKKTQ